ncbi:bifunctional DNA primase/polymerase [Ruficoccus amylovorans]|uniref:Bifunctional DNA primase/polymerase n=1 Tax=Ruficoccus amylovorans TaxID=1804625 RepID=A0A842HMG9_9BACT|nr:phage/plasmid primase, P4 family [Ruficoccus amylovorans]MBC2596281.1 bifunctional DNA primase/polymerase [Ruficoccus amylovorans]
MHNLLTILGENTVLLKLPCGEKYPSNKNWQKTTLAEMTPDYLEELSSGRFNIGVLLGKPSSGLCSIDIDQDEAVEPFLQLNPTLQSSLRTRGARGANIWVRIVGEHPKLTKLKNKQGAPWGEFRADGGQTVIWGKHPSGCNYSIAAEQPIVEIPFEEINWPTDLQCPWRDVEALDSDDTLEELFTEQGPPFIHGEKGGVTLNQGCLAALFSREHLMIYIPEEGEFYCYNGENGLWEHKQLTTIKGMIDKLVRRLMIENELTCSLAKITAPFIESVLTLFRPKVEKPGAFTHPQSIIHVHNGVIDISGEEYLLKSFSPEFYSRNQIPVEYVEEATCPRFVHELLEPCLGPEDIDLIQRIMGSILLPYNAAQAIILITGAAGSGKSTFVDLAEKLIGKDNIYELRTNNLNGRFELQFYVGKRLLAGKDVPGHFLQEKGASILKKLSGGDTLSAEKKGLSTVITLQGDFHIIITSNSDLHVMVDGDSEAWRRRLIILEWSKRNTGRPNIPKFSEQLLQEEGSGILNWMLEGLHKHSKELSSHGGFLLNDSQRLRIDTLLNESDSVRAFVTEKLVLSPGGTITSRDLFYAYENYCDEQGWEPYGYHKAIRKFPALIQERYGLRRSHDIRVGDKELRGYRGLAIQD